MDDQSEAGQVEEPRRLTAREEAAREGVSERTIYKRRAERRAQNRAAAGELEASAGLPVLTQVQAMRKQLAVQAELLKEADTLKGELKAKTEEVDHYRGLLERVISAGFGGRPRSRWAWVTEALIILLLGGLVFCAWWWAFRGPAVAPGTLI